MTEGIQDTAFRRQWQAAELMGELYSSYPPTQSSSGGQAAGDKLSPPPSAAAADKASPAVCMRRRADEIRFRQFLVANPRDSDDDHAVAQLAATRSVQWLDDGAQQEVEAALKGFRLNAEQGAALMEAAKRSVTLLQVTYK